MVNRMNEKGKKCHPSVLPCDGKDFDGFHMLLIFF